MSTETVRAYITRVLEPNLPADWTVEPGIPTLSNLAKPILWIEYTAFEPLPEAPNAKIQASADLCIATNKTDLRKGEDDADESVAELYEAALVARAFRSITARKTVFSDIYVGWRLSITIVTTNPAETAPVTEE